MPRTTLLLSCALFLGVLVNSARSDNNRPATQPNAVKITAKPRPTTQPASQPDFADMRALLAAIPKDYWHPDTPVSRRAEVHKGLKGKTLIAQAAVDDTMAVGDGVAISLRGNLPPFRPLGCPLDCIVLVRLAPKHDARDERRGARVRILAKIDVVYFHAYESNATFEVHCHQVNLPSESKR